MVGAAVWKPRVPNDKLHRVTDNRLAEADPKVLHGLWLWSTGIRGLMRGMATLLQGNHEHLVVKDKVGRPQVSLW